MWPVSKLLWAVLLWSWCVFYINTSFVYCQLQYCRHFCQIFIKLYEIICGHYALLRFNLASKTGMCVCVCGQWLASTCLHVSMVSHSRPTQPPPLARLSVDLHVSMTARCFLVIWLTVCDCESPMRVNTCEHVESHTSRDVYTGCVPCCVVFFYFLFVSSDLSPLTFDLCSQTWELFFVFYHVVTDSSVSWWLTSLADTDSETDTDVERQTAWHAEWS